MINMMDLPSPSVQSCLSILQKIPPKKASTALKSMKDALTSSKPEAIQELMQTYLDFPLKSAEDPKNNKQFLLCEFNRHLESYRSPFSSNTYVPSLAGGDNPRISDYILTFEAHANEVWERYTQLYYGKDAIGSVYAKPIATGSSLMVCFLVKKDVEDDSRLAKGQWNSGHIVQIGKIIKGSAKYKIRSMITVTMDPSNETCISAQITRETEETHDVSEEENQASHLTNVGKMIESIEIDLRSNLGSVNIPKTKQVVCDMRQVAPGGPTGVPTLFGRPSSTTSKKKSFLPPGAMRIPGMGGAHAAALNAAVLKRASKK